jgi:hypothetical protein
MDDVMDAIVAVNQNSMSPQGRRNDSRGLGEANGESSHQEPGESFTAYPDRAHNPREAWTHVEETDGRGL